MIKHQYFVKNKFLLTIMYSDVTSEEINSLITKLQAIEFDGEGMRGLTILCRNTKVRNVSAKDIINFGQRMKKVSFRKNGKNAFVAKTLLSYGLTRMYQVATEILNLDELKVYKENELSDALEWLDAVEMKEEINAIINTCES